MHLKELADDEIVIDGIDLKNIKGDTPFHLAAVTADVDKINLLVRKAAASLKRRSDFHVNFHFATSTATGVRSGYINASTVPSLVSSMNTDDESNSWLSPPSSAEIMYFFYSYSNDKIIIFFSANNDDMWISVLLKLNQRGWRVLWSRRSRFTWCPTFTAFPSHSWHQCRYCHRQ